jgi:glycosyltransferase involved in cell wall biosynthesis
VKLLIFSSSSIISINRTYIRSINLFFNFEIHLAILYKKNIVESHNGISDYKNEPFDVSIHEIIGLHPRLEIIRNLETLICQVKPNYILLEYDTASYITYKTLKIAKKLDIKVGTIIVENRFRNYLKEFYNNLFSGNIKNSLGSLFCLIFQNFAKKNINNLFPISKEAVNVSEKYGFKQNLIYQIPYGVDLLKFVKQNEAYIDATKKKLGLNSFTIAYFGRLVPEKGVDILLKAASILKERNFQILIDNFSFYKSDYIIYLKKLIERYNLTNQIVFFDSDHNQMPDYYNAVDLVVLPSIETINFKEQYGRVLVEAMSCETLVIGSNTGAIGEILDNEFLLFESNSVDSLVTKISEIMNLNSKTKAEIIKKSFIRANSSLGVEHQARIIGSVIKQ